MACDYCLQWPAVVCDILVVGALIAAFTVIAKYKRKNQVVYGEELWRPCWKGVHPVGLLVYRTFVFLVTVALLAVDFVKGAGLHIIYFYTEWTFTLVIIYFGLATLISAKGCSQLAKTDSVRDQHERANFLKLDPEQGSDASERHRMSLDERKKRAGFWGYAMQIIFQICAGAVMMTDIVFWLILVPFLSKNRFSLNLFMGSMHSVNALVLLIDAALNSMRFPLFRGAYFVLWTALYVIFQLILHACGFSWWPYPFLELSTPWAPLWYFAMAIVCILCYGIFASLVKLKEWLFAKWFPYSYQSLY